jgi:hypothetical protein
VLGLAQNTQGMVNTTVLRRELGWDKKRSALALDLLLREGMVWLDQPVRSIFAPFNVRGSYSVML